MPTVLVVKYDLKRPCPKCPFLRDGPIELRAGRIEELAQCRGEFQCHQTVNYDELDDDGDPVGREANAQHCAGALIYAEKMGGAHQMARINERLGFYDVNELDEDAFDLVWEDVDEWIFFGST